MKIFIGYVPVIHRGYLKVFEQLGDICVYLLDGELLEILPYLSRDVRACSAVATYQMVKQFVRRAGIVATPESLLAVVKGDVQVVMPDEDISHALADKYLYLSGVEVEFLSLWLRWDKKSTVSEQEPRAQRQLSQDDFDRELIGIAYREAVKSSDWWRQVGGVLVDDGRVLITAFNQHQPTDYSPYIHGDPRGNFTFGERIDLSSALHAEAAIVARAAARGIATAGKSLYVSTFPCPSCAYLVKEAGISKLYYCDGYSLLAADEILSAADVEIVKVVMK